VAGLEVCTLKVTRLVLATMSGPLRGLFVVLTVGLCVTAAWAAGVAAVGATPTDSQQASGPCTGEVTENATGVTLVSVQGTRFLDSGATKTAGYVMAVSPAGEIQWVQNNSADGRWWTYDVSPLPNGTLFQVTTENQDVIVSEYDPETGERRWEQEFESAHDAHDAELHGDEIIVADKGRDRIFAYNRTQETITWQWNFSEYFDASHGGPAEDWTHLNDVDRIDEHRYLLSAKHFNQVLIVNRTTGEVEEIIGDDEDPSILDEQHNPQYQVAEDGTETVLVADSENDRVVEFEKTADGWAERYVLHGGGLHQPRDADWLPTGNLLVSDRLGHRVLEVTPTGEVVWEVYSPWQTYDAERVAWGEEPDAPNSVDLNASGHFLVDSESVPESTLEDCATYLRSREGLTGAIGTPVDEVPDRVTPVDKHGREGLNDSSLPLPVLVGVAAIVVLLGGALALWTRREN
jgi:hypothetical protein